MDPANLDGAEYTEAAKLLAAVLARLPNAALGGMVLLDAARREKARRTEGLPPPAWPAWWCRSCGVVQQTDPAGGVCPACGLRRE